MNELDILKKELGRLFKLLGRSLRARVEKIIFDLQVEQNAARRTRVLIALGLSLIFFGSFLAQGISKGKVRVPGVLGPLGLESFLNFSPAGVLTDEDGNLLLVDFEHKEDLSVFDKNYAAVSLSKDHASEGSQSARIVMEGGKPWSGVVLEEFFAHSTKLSDWSSFQSFQFYVFNPGKDIERLLVQIKDQWGRKYKSDFLLQPGKGVDVSIPVKTIGASINVRKIDQVNLFRWAPRDTKELYFDAIRLIRSDVREVSAEPKKVKETAPPAKPLGVNPVDYGFKARKKAWAVQPSSLEGDLVRIPFVIVNETEAPCVLCPVEGSIPFPMGEVQDVRHLRLRTAQDQEIPFQPRVLARWPDGSLKWMAPHFNATVMPGESIGLYLDYGPNVQPIIFTSPLRVEDKSSAVTVNTGEIRVTLSRKNFYLFDEASLDLNGNGNFEPSEVMLRKAPLFVQSRGKEFTADLDRKSYELEVEEAGPLRAVIKASGSFNSPDGGRFCKVIVRYYFYQAQSYMKISHTFIYTGYPENKAFQGYANLTLPENETVQSFGFRLPLVFEDPMQTKISLGARAPEVIDLQESSTIRLLQKEWKKAELLTDAQNIPPADYYSSWMDVSDLRGGVTAALRNFRENFPKAFSVNRVKGEFQIDLWPAEAGELNLATTPEALGPKDAARGSAFGLGKTHEILLNFHGQDALKAHAAERAYSFSKRLLIRNNPYWLESTGALGRLFPVSDKYAAHERILERLFDWAARMPKKFGWYGMLNYGDTLSGYRSQDRHKKYNAPGWHPEGRWGWFHTEGAGNAAGGLLQFARSGLYKYFEFSEAAARHAMDIQTIHHDTINADPRLKKILNPKMSQRGSMHRHAAQHWSGRSDSASHTQVLGILLYYYLSGDERALDVVKEIGDYFLSDPYYPPGANRPFSHRALANVLWGDSLLYTATADERFKKAADKIAEIYVKGQQADGSFLQFYDFKSHQWSGKKNRLLGRNHVLGALTAYYELTQDLKVKEVILKLVQDSFATDFSSAFSLQGAAAAYWLTGDPQYLAFAEKGLRELKLSQHSPRDPMLDGMIFDKPSYLRSSQILASAPYAFAALEDGFEKALQERKKKP